MQKAAGCFYVLCSGLIPNPWEGTALGENFNGHMVQLYQNLCCCIWQHTGTNGCLATNSPALRPGANTWYPAGRGLSHLCQLSVKAYTLDAFNPSTSLFTFCMLLLLCHFSVCSYICFDVKEMGTSLVYSVTKAKKIQSIPLIFKTLRNAKHGETYKDPVERVRWCFKNKMM